MHWNVRSNIAALQSLQGAAGCLAPGELGGAARTGLCQPNSQSLIRDDPLHGLGDGVRILWVELEGGAVGDTRERFDRRARRGNTRSHRFKQRKAEAFELARVEER